MMLLFNKLNSTPRIRGMAMIGQMERNSAAVKNGAGKGMGQGGFAAARFSNDGPLFAGKYSKIDIF